MFPRYTTIKLIKPLKGYRKNREGTYLARTTLWPLIRFCFHLSNIVLTENDTFFFFGLLSIFAVRAVSFSFHTRPLSLPSSSSSSSSSPPSPSINTTATTAATRCIPEDLPHLQRNDRGDSIARRHQHHQRSLRGPPQGQPDLLRQGRRHSP